MRDSGQQPSDEEARGRRERAFDPWLLSEVAAALGGTHELVLREELAGWLIGQVASACAPGVARVAVLVDVTGSMKAAMSDVGDAVSSLAAHVSDQCRLALYTYSDRAYVGHGVKRVDFDEDGSALRGRFSEIEAKGGGAHLRMPGTSWTS